MQAMAQEMEQMHQMLQNVGKSIEMQEQERKDFEANIKAYQAETQRISAVQAGMTEEQIQDVVMGTLHGMITSGDLVGEMPGREPIEMMPESAEYAQPQQGMQ
jgi:Cu/Ag efflux pump CusA